MGEASSAVTVVGLSRRADVSLPSGVAVAELLPDLVGLLEDHSNEDAPRRWALLRLGGDPLDDERGLEDQGVLDGAMLFLRDATAPPPPPVVEDIVESVAIAVEVRPGRWSAETAHGVLLGAAAAWGLGVAAAAAAAGPADQRAGWATAGAVGLVLSACAARLAGRALAAAVLALAALPCWAVAGAAIAAGASAGDALGADGAAAGVAAGAAAAWFVSPAAAGPAAAGLLVTVPWAAAAAVGEALGLGAAAQAAVLAAFWMAAADQAPSIAALVTGVAPGARAPLDVVGPVAERVERAHRLLSWLLTGAALALAGAMVALAAVPSVPARALCAAVAVAVALRARRYRFRAQVLPLGLAGLAGAAALTAAAVHGAAAPTAVGLTLGGALAWTALALAVPGLGEASPRRRLLLERVELAVNLSLVPLVFAVLGVFDLAVEVARRFS
ncbi:MAG TPA: type VII secretion integral membrane protein EccD [Terriglobales bacterium]|nr:type VII secretion integral membrane protein EccD [Terriglobales bacterium]